MLGLEREGLGEVAVEVGGALAGDPVQEIERDVVESGITKSVHRASDVVRRGVPLEHGEQVRLEALRAQRDPVDAALAQQPRQLGSHRLRVRLHGELVRRRQRPQQARQLLRLGEGRRAAAEEDRLDAIGENLPLERELGEERVDVRAVLLVAADHGDEVAVPAAVRAEGKVDVEVADRPRLAAHRLRSESRLSTARKASCGTSTPPTCFIRFLPFFCLSSSLRFRVMSPP